ncbi:MAG: flagellar basal-body rod protein FlgF [Rickettsiales bacterium]|nr:flagellar basal-body rod protein FlgF [Rickettsiales bacterium]
MDNSIYIMLSRQTALFRKMESTANNIANSTTAGYQAERNMFVDYLVDDGNKRKMAFTQDKASYLDTREGPIQSTGETFDMAISGDGYFTVQQGNNRRYTRAGNFTIDSQGFIINPSGAFLLDDGGQRIQVEQNVREFVVGENGSLSADGQDIGTIGIAEFANTQQLEHESGTLFRATGQPLAATRSRVLQGVLEKSNVEPVQELVAMTQINRATTSTAKFIELVYDLQRKSSNVYAQGSNG